MADLSSIRVLVIDDDADARANLCDILEPDGWQVETAGSAAEAFARDDWAELTAILLDRKLPDGSAEDLLPRLKHLAPQAAILIVTGHSHIEGAIAAIREGAADYILKPVNADVIRSRLGSIVEAQTSRAGSYPAEQGPRTPSHRTADPARRCYRAKTSAGADFANRTAGGHRADDDRPGDMRAAMPWPAAGHASTCSPGRSRTAKKPWT